MTGEVMTGEVMADEVGALARRQANVCRVLSSFTRVMILCALADRELSVGDIAAASGASMQNTSKHLRLMKDNGLLRSRREANHIFYRVNLEGLRRDCQLLQNVLTFSETQPRRSTSIREAIST